MIKLKTLLSEAAMGDCYHVSGKFMLNVGEDDKHRLVHSMVDGQGDLDGLRFGHAWVEYGNKVIDNSNGKFREYPKNVYYATGNIKKSDTKYYNYDDVLVWVVKSGHWGPWEMRGDTVKLREDIPTKKKQIGKRFMKLNKKELDI